MHVAQKVEDSDRRFGWVDLIGVGIQCWVVSLSVGVSVHPVILVKRDVVHLNVSRHTVLHVNFIKPDATVWKGVVIGKLRHVQSVQEPNVLNQLFVELLDGIGLEILPLWVNHSASVISCSFETEGVALSLDPSLEHVVLFVAFSGVSLDPDWVVDAEQITVHLRPARCDHVGEVNTAWDNITPEQSFCLTRDISFLG
jgi:hypothetical protein